MIYSNLLTSKYLSTNIQIIVSAKSSYYWLFGFIPLVRQLQSSQTLMSHILISPHQNAQIDIFIAQYVWFLSKVHGFSNKNRFGSLIQPQRGSWRLIIRKMRKILLFLCINQPLWVCIRTNISNFNTKSSPPNQSFNHKKCDLDNFIILQIEIRMGPLNVSAA